MTLIHLSYSYFSVLLKTLYVYLSILSHAQVHISTSTVKIQNISITARIPHVVLYNLERETFWRVYCSLFFFFTVHLVVLETLISCHLCWVMKHYLVPLLRFFVVILQISQHGNVQPSNPSCSQHPLLMGKFSSQFSSSSARLSLAGRVTPVLGRVSLHASHSCLQMKIFPSLKKVRKNLTFLFFAFLFLKLRYSCFTMLCWFLLYNKWISHMYTYIPCLSSFLLPWTPAISLQSARLGSLCYTAASHWLWFTYIGGDKSVLLFQFVHHPQPMSTCLFCMSVCVLSHVWLFCDRMDGSPPGFSVHGVFQARILESVAILYFRRSSRPRDWTWVSHIAGRFFYH